MVTATAVAKSGRAIPATLQECGERLGVSRERVRQIEEQALAKLRRAILADPVFAEIVGQMFTIEPVATFEPEKVVATLPQAIDVPAYLVEVLRVLGATTVDQIRASTDLETGVIRNGLRGLIEKKLVAVTFKGERCTYRLVKGGAL